MFNLNGKVALVAGGAGHLGTPVCEALCGQGATLMIADQCVDRAEALAARLRDTGGAARVTNIDLTQEASVQGVVRNTVQQFGRLDILVNMTYFAIGKLVGELSAEEFDMSNRVNLTGTFLLARASANAMTNGGSIILFSSMYGQVSPDPGIYHAPMNPNPIEYGVAKAGIIQMTKYLAVAWASRAIRVNAVAPGPFPNPGVQQDSPDFIQRLARKVPLGRIGRNHEIAGPVVLLAADESSYITGETIGVNGGWTAW